MGERLEMGSSGHSQLVHLETVESWPVSHPFLSIHAYPLHGSRDRRLINAILWLGQLPKIRAPQGQSSRLPNAIFAIGTVLFAFTSQP